MGAREFDLSMQEFFSKFCIGVQKEIDEAAEV